MRHPSPKSRLFNAKTDVASVLCLPDLCRSTWCCIRQAGGLAGESQTAHGGGCRYSTTCIRAKEEFGPLRFVISMWA
jgi:hypothetical protein